MAIKDNTGGSLGCLKSLIEKLGKSPLTGEPVPSAMVHGHPAIGWP
jgi:hypothetical protein